MLTELSVHVNNEEDNTVTANWALHSFNYITSTDGYFWGVLSKHLVQYFTAQWTPVEINSSTGKFKSLPKEQI